MTQDEMWLLDEKYGGERTEAFLDDCVRLKLGEPLAYVIGHIPFRSALIHLDSRPLIPRTESEFWIGEIIDTLKDTTRPIRVLDLCAGSGALGIAILMEIPGSTVDFAEIEEKHHATIMKNILTNVREKDRARVFGGDLFENIPHTYDLIITNPPYIDPTLDRTQASVKEFEPAVALYGGKDGMEIIERIITEAPAHLTPHGILVIEHEPEQSPRIQGLALRQDLIATTHTDQYDTERYTVLTRKAV